MLSKCKYHLFCILLPLLIVGSANADLAGSRPIITSFVFPLIRQILKLDERLLNLEMVFMTDQEQIKEKYEKNLADLRAKREDASRIGLPLINDSKSDLTALIDKRSKQKDEQLKKLSDKYNKDKDKTEEDLKSALASPDDRKLLRQMESTKDGSGSRESLEAYNAALNLQNLVKEQIEKLKARPTDYALAIKSYATQQRLVAIVIGMNEKFYSNIDAKYIPEFKSLIQRAGTMHDEFGQSSVDAALVASQQGKMRKIQETLRDGIAKMNEMKPMMNNRIAELRQFETTVVMLEKSAQIAKDSSDVVLEVKTQFAQLDLPMPEIVEFDLKTSDFELPSE